MHQKTTTNDLAVIFLTQINWIQNTTRIQTWMHFTLFTQLKSKYTKCLPKQTCTQYLQLQVLNFWPHVTYPTPPILHSHLLLQKKDVRRRSHTNFTLHFFLQNWLWNFYSLPLCQNVDLPRNTTPERNNIVPSPLQFSCFAQFQIPPFDTLFLWFCTDCLQSSFSFNTFLLLMPFCQK